MTQQADRITLPHNLVLENREKLSLTGVTDVDSFDESTIVAYTDCGELTIGGENLHICKLNIEDGELKIEGNISSLNYLSNKPKSGGLFAKVFR